MNIVKIIIALAPLLPDLMGEVEQILIAIEGQVTGKADAADAAKALHEAANRLTAASQS